jgi:acyl-CoA synthetase (NDP forming)
MRGFSGSRAGAELSRTAATGVAIVGAREGTIWTTLLSTNLEQFGYHGDIWPVSRTRREVSGLPAFPSLPGLPSAPDAVVILTAALDAVDLARQSVALGVPHVVVLSDGFAERGTQAGADLQRELATTAAGSATRLYGPNGVGFADFTGHFCPIATPLPRQLAVGPTAIISHSGSMLSSIAAGLAEDNVGVDWCVSIGNGAAFEFHDALEYAVARPTTQIICGYVESFGRAGRARIEEVFRLAQESGKPTVLIKAGASDLSARVALSHTASIAGEDRVVNDIFDRYGVIRVASAEELVRTVSLLLYLGQSSRSMRARDRNGIAVIEGSGGVAAVLADQMSQGELTLARFAPETLSSLRALALPGAYVENPIDLHTASKSFEAMTEAYRTVYIDPSVSAVLIPWALTFPAGDDGRDGHRAILERYARLARETGTPTIISSLTVHAWTDWMLKFRARYPELLLVRGLQATITALRHAQRPGASAPLVHADLVSDSFVDESRSRDIIASLSLPLVNGAFCEMPLETIAERTSTLTPPFAVKVIATGLGHRARVGGVITGCRSQHEVQAAASTVCANAIAAGVATEAIRGVLVEEMAFGAEIFVGFRRDEWFGPYVVLARGGTKIAAGAPNLILPAPPPADITTALHDLGFSAGSQLQQNIARSLAGLISRTCHEFISGALQGYTTVEFNPVILGIHGPVIADVLLAHE